MKRAGLTALALLILNMGRAYADAPSFAVVNLSGNGLPPAVVTEAEREYARLRPAMTPIADAQIKRLLATGETASAAVTRLVDEARAKRSVGACIDAIPLATQAEDVALNNVAPDEARDPLKAIYTLMVACEDNLGRAQARDQAARRLRALVALAPDDLPAGLWEAYVEKAVPGPGTVELQVDSEPPNAQILLNFHAVGVTPTTVKLPPGEVLIELQKEGYKKAFRRIEMQNHAERTVFRLIDVKRDRSELVVQAMVTLGGKDELRDHPRTLSQLAQWARADALVLLRAAGDRVSIEFFDAERGQLAQEHLFSHYDAQSGRIDVLAQKPTPAGGPGNEQAPKPGILAPVGKDGRASANKVALSAPENEGLKETYKGTNVSGQGPPNRGTGPWWGWLIAAAVAAGIAAVVISDQPRRSNTIDVNAGF
ncbi:MAG: PEGA domain-containing protein [Deltaproteobacteria bacterium]|nr:PEGA domain-containing protein [Deltaproteobacteria bacterium]